MDFEQLKNLIPRKGEKYIIVENGKPIMVLLSFEEYQEKLKNPENAADFQIKEVAIPSLMEEAIEQPNEEIDRELYEKEKKDLKLEDLPF